MKFSHKLMFLLGAPFLLAACGKSYTCTHGIDYRNPGMIFKGFTPSQLSQVLVKKYKANTNFSNFVATDTIDASSGYLMGDTMVVKHDFDYTGFIWVDKGIDYEILVTATNQFYRITDIKSGAESRTWTEDTPCSPGASMNEMTTLSMKLNGADYSCFTPLDSRYSPANYLFCLIH